MAYLDSKFLFFTTSPRSPAKMIPEITLLIRNFSGQAWNKETQIAFIDALAASDFFEGAGSPKDKAFSARDRINRAPKSLGFIDLSPSIELTDAGKEFILGKHPHEIFLRQLLKFQLPSPYHIEKDAVKGTFFIRPYLEILRLIRELEYLSFDELKVFAVQLTDYRKFDQIKKKILEFRQNKKKNKGTYKKFLDAIWTAAIVECYRTTIEQGKTKTRETSDSSLKKFIATKKSNHRDYADACFRYLRYTELISIEHKSRKLQFYPNKIKEVDFILKTIDRSPVFVADEAQYKKHLFSASAPPLFYDARENVVDSVMRIGNLSKRELVGKSVDELKDLLDKIIQKKKANVINARIQRIKSYSLYSEIMDTYNEIISDGLYDAPLMLEYNTWRAMTMLDGGEIKGNLRFDDAGEPLSTAQGNMPDIECDYGGFVLSVEVTMQNGQRQYEAEGEPVARHYGQMKQRTGKDAYCLFVAPTINPATLVHFYGLNRLDNYYYGGKTKIIPLELDQFMKLLISSYNYSGHPQPKDVKSFLDSVIDKINESKNENDWRDKIQECVDLWLVS